MVITYRHRKEIWNENNDNSSKSRQSSIGSQVHVHARFHDKKFVVFYARMLLLCQIFTCTVYIAGFQANNLFKYIRVAMLVTIFFIV